MQVVAAHSNLHLPLGLVPPCEHPHCHLSLHSTYALTENHRGTEDCQALIPDYHEGTQTRHYSSLEFAVRCFLCDSWVQAERYKSCWNKLPAVH